MHHREVTGVLVLLRDVSDVRRLNQLVLNKEAAIKEVEAALKTEDKTAIEEKNTALSTVSQKLGEKMYADMQAKQAAEAAAGNAGGADASGGQGASAHAADDNVVDAEVKEVKKG